MSPPTVVVRRELVNIPTNCPIIEIPQNECDFDRATHQYKCRPLVRAYRACDTPNGKQHFEITNLPSLDIEAATKQMISMADKP